MIAVLAAFALGLVAREAILSLCARRGANADLRTATRLVLNELLAFRSLALDSLVMPADRLPRLWTAAPDMWRSHRAVLARAAPAEAWDALANAYAYVDALCASVTFVPSGSLAPSAAADARRLLAAMLAPVERAAAALDALQVEGRPPMTHGMEASSFDDSATKRSLA